MKTYHIFLASSIELESDRKYFVHALTKWNHNYEKEGREIRFIPDMWEFASKQVEEEGKQVTYDRYINTCDIFIMLYSSKVGSYCEGEYDLALQRFYKTGWPKIYVFKSTQVNPAQSYIDQQSVKAFEQKLLEEIKHFKDHYTGGADLMGQIKAEIDYLFSTKDLKYGDAQLLFGYPNDLPQTFIGRKREIAAIQDFFNGTASKKELMLYSDGGLGKTTLAANYWFQNQQNYSYCAWLFCENGIINGMEAIAGVQIKDFSGNDSEYKQSIIISYLNNLATEGRCLLVLDNVNDEKHLNEWHDQYSGLKWEVLITSRLNNVCETEIPVNPLSIEDGASLFYSYYDREHGSAIDPLVYQLLPAISCNTLIIEIVSKNLAFMSKTGESLEIFFNKLKVKGIFASVDDVSINTNYTANVHKKADTAGQVLDLLYDLRLVDEQSIKLIKLLALLPAINYPFKLLFEIFKPIDKKDFLLQLNKLRSWFQIDNDSITLSTLVQDMVIGRCDNVLPDGYEDLVERFCFLIDEENNPISEIAERYMPVAEGLLANCHRIMPNYTVPLFNLIIDLQYLKKKILRIDVNISLSYKALKHYINKNEDGQHRIALLEAYKMFVEVCKELSGFEEALYFQQVIITIMEAIPASDKDIAKEIHNAGFICYSWHKYDESIFYYRQQLNRYPHLLIPNSLSLARWQNFYGLALLGLEDHESLIEAEKAFRNALTIKLRYYPQTNKMVMNSQIDLASVLHLLGGESNLIEASILCESFLSNINTTYVTYQKVANIQFALSDISIRLGGEGYLEKAIKWSRSSLATLMENYDKARFKVATCQSNLALLLHNSGGRDNLEEAEILLRSAVLLDIENLGEESPKLAARLFNLASVLRKIGGEEKLIEAISLLRKALAINILNFGENDPIIADSIRELSVLQTDLDLDYYKEEIIQLLRSALAMNILNYEDNDLQIGESRLSLAVALHKIGELAEAKSLYEQTVFIFTHHFGAANSKVLIFQSYILDILVETGGEKNLNEAKKLVESILSIDFVNPPGTYPMRTTFELKLAEVLLKLEGEDNLNQAEQILRNKLSVDLLYYGEIHREVVISKLDLSRVLIDLGSITNLDEAKTLLRSALLLGDQVFERNSAVLQEVRENLASLLFIIDHEDDLEEAYELLRINAEKD